MRESSGRHLRGGCSAGTREALLEIPNQVVGPLDPDREPYRPRPDSGGPQLVVVELTVGRARGMNDEALRITHVGEVGPQGHAADEVLPRSPAAAAVEREHGAGT